MSKFTKIPSEISKLFSEKRGQTAMNDFAKLLDTLTVDNRLSGERSGRIAS